MVAPISVSGGMERCLNAFYGTTKASGDKSSRTRAEGQVIFRSSSCFFFFFFFLFYISAAHASMPMHWCFFFPNSDGFSYLWSVNMLFGLISYYVDRLYFLRGQHDSVI